MTQYTQLPIRKKNSNRFYETEQKPIEIYETEREAALPPTSVLLKLALKKIFRFKSIAIVFNYLMRKTGIYDSVNQIEDGAFKKMDSFFNS